MREWFTGDKPPPLKDVWALVEGAADGEPYLVQGVARDWSDLDKQSGIRFGRWIETDCGPDTVNFLPPNHRIVAWRFA